MSGGGRGPADPQRRARIVAAVRSLIVDVGVRGVTHRRAAAAAGVPLAATTYYFAGLDDMIEEAFASAMTDDFASIAAEVGAIPAGADLAFALAEIVHRRVADRPGAILASELGVFAFRSDRGAQLTAAWGDAWATALAGRLDPATARVAVLLSTSLIQGNGASPERMPVAEIEVVLRRGIDGPG